MRSKINSKSILIIIGLFFTLSFAFLNTKFYSDTTVSTDLKPGAVRFHMTAPVLDGKLEGAMKLAEELSKHVNDTFPGHNLEAFRENKGEQIVIHWFADFESEENFNEFEKLLAANEGFKNIEGKVGLWFGRPSDKLLHAIY